MDKARIQEIKQRALMATEGPILEREDTDYYQSGTYLGTEPFYYDKGEFVDGISPLSRDQYFNNDIFRVEGKDEDKDLFINARQDILYLIDCIEKLEKTILHSAKID